jgi:hypothetical protein
MKSKLKVIFILIILLMCSGILYMEVTYKRPPDKEEIAEFINNNEETLNRLVTIAKEDKRFLCTSKGDAVWEDSMGFTPVDDEVHDLFNTLVDTKFVTVIYEEDPRTYNEKKALNL